MSGEPEPDRGRQESFRKLLRSLRVWDTELPHFDPATAPADPLPLFQDWLCAAARAGTPEPHTMTLATADASGRPSARTVMLNDADERGWHFATHRTSRKGRDLAARPEAALAFYWPAVGRQVRVQGRVTAASTAETRADLARRSTSALVLALLDRQSEVLPSCATLERTVEAAWERAEREPDAPADSWRLYVLAADEVEFYQGDVRCRHVRLRYRRDSPEAPWATDLLWP
ncbi:pyridoxal 5'-phosphate synthase [Streptomyces sp. NPDC049577]|uniref:pyridoxine/pyridoxamine 5'-phosphate oxidase n=1 Tax=Streptomyces sp. NPDC049577 TaxID=3155153 RepID=UPI00344398D7